MVGEVKIIRILKDKWVVFCATFMIDSLPCRKTSGHCTLYGKCHFKGKTRTVPMFSSVYSISNSWLTSHTSTTNSFLKCVYILSYNYCI